MTLIYLPYIAATFANVGIDIAGASLYWNDVKNTGSVRNFLNFLELLNIDQITEILPDYSTNITRLPSLLMMIVAARLFVFPVINAWFGIIVTTIWWEVSSSINRKNKNQRRDSADGVEAPKIIPIINEPDPEEVIQSIDNALDNNSQPPPNASETMKTAVTFAMQEHENLEPEVEQRPLSGFNDADFVRRLDGIVKQGLEQYQETGVSSVNRPVRDIAPEEDPRVWTGLLYPTVPAVVGASSSSSEKKDERTY